MSTKFSRRAPDTKLFLWQMEIPGDPNADPTTPEFMGHTCGDAKNPQPCIYDVTITKMAMYPGQEQLEVTLPDGDKFKAQLYNGEMYHPTKVNGEEAGVSPPGQPVPVEVPKIETMEDKQMKEMMPSAGELAEWAAKHPVCFCLQTFCQNFELGSICESSEDG